jgi:hypothetical protein
LKKCQFFPFFSFTFCVWSLVTQVAAALQPGKSIFIRQSESHRGFLQILWYWVPEITLE